MTAKAYAIRGAFNDSLKTHTQSHVNEPLMPQSMTDYAFVAKRKHVSSSVWSRTIADLMASSGNLRSQHSLAKRSGVAQSTIGRILRGEVAPQSDNLERLAKAFGVSYSTFVALAEGDKLEGRAPGAPVKRAARRVPLISWPQAAELASSSEPYPFKETAEWIACPKKRAGLRTVALKVSGESMEPEYQHGDVIYVDPSAKAANGKDVVVYLMDRGSIVFRRLVIDGEHRYLKPLNPYLTEGFIHITAGTRIIGVVIGKYVDK